MDDLETLPGIGPALAAALREADIDSPSALRGLGAVEAWHRVHPRFDCMHSLLALESAVCGIPRAAISAERREELREEAHAC